MALHLVIYHHIFVELELTGPLLTFLHETGYCMKGSMVVHVILFGW
jgi:hypothetical protein